MPFTPIPLTARITMAYQQGNREYQNVLHARKATGWDATTLQQLADTAALWWQNSVSPGRSNRVGLVSVTCTDVSEEGGAQYVRPVSPPIIGGINTPPVPANATVTISWRTARTGRRYRGRTYVVGLHEVEVADDDTIVGATVASLTAAGSAWLTALAGISAQPVVASYTYGTAEPITSARVENVVDSQRRRLPGRGR